MTKTFKWPTRRLSLNTGGTAFHNSMVLLSSGWNPPVFSLCFKAPLTYKTPHQLLQETGNYYMHIIFLHCWHTAVITAPLYLLPPDKINAATTAPQLIFLHPALLYFPSSFQGEANVCHIYCPGAQRLLRILVISDFFTYCCTYFTLLWISMSAKCINCICARQHFFFFWGLLYCCFFGVFCTLEFYFYTQHEEAKCFIGQIKYERLPPESWHREPS